MSISGTLSAHEDLDEMREWAIDCLWAMSERNDDLERRIAKLERLLAKIATLAAEHF